jgi:hypothetical protein
MQSCCGSGENNAFGKKLKDARSECHPENLKGKT